MLTFCMMYGVQPRRNFDHTIAEPEVHQADTELFVDIGDSATLQCCVYGTDIGVVIWYKQPNRKQPRIMCRTYKTDKETFFHEFQNPRFQAERSSNCSNMIISNIIQSDEAVYYCSIVSPYSVFGNGTYLKIKGKKDTISSGTSKPGLCDDSVHGDCTKNTTQEKAVLGLGSALGLCVLMIFCLIYFLLRRRKCDQMNASIEDSPGMRQEAEDESLNYAALKFSKRKEKVENSRMVSTVQCVYSSVKHDCNM
ncbi:uncharacterized protein LOC124386332 [Silurus meridionalis]|uniref:uncharacterized protein LOC124386332 n=1 Tax=Silurus meridionalis TaxID=175797 RepID=UPI001EEC0B06|nr:uncharacterized protein LOC124386332 [Silurus meridionalis]